MVLPNGGIAILDPSMRRPRLRPFLSSPTVIPAKAGWRRDHLLALHPQPDSG